MAGSPTEFQLPKGGNWVSRDIVQSLADIHKNYGAEALERCLTISTLGVVGDRTMHHYLQAIPLIILVSVAASLFCC